MGGVCDKIEKPDPKSISMTDKTTGDVLSTNPCGLFARDDNGGYTSGYTLESLSNSLVQYPPNYCIRYGPITWLGPVATFAITIALVVADMLIPGIAAADAGVDAAVDAGLDAGLDAGEDAGVESIEMADMAGDEDPEYGPEQKDNPAPKNGSSSGEKIKSVLKYLGRLGKSGLRGGLSKAPLVAQGTFAASVISVTKQMAELKSTAEDIGKFCTSIGDLDENGDPQWISDFSASIPSKEYQNWFLDVTPDGNSCSAADLGPNYVTFPKFGVCRGRCPNPGKKPACVRNKVGSNLVFSGNPVSCCFADYRINGDGKTGDFNPPSCYEDPSTKQRTCHPWYRDLSSTTCQAQITPYCLGEAFLPDQKDWMEMWLLDSSVNLSSFMEINNDAIPNDWNSVDSDSNLSYNTVSEKALSSGNKRTIKQPCLTAIARAMYVNTDQVANWQDLKNFKLLSGSVNKVGFPWAQEVLNLVFQKYLKEYGSFIGGVDQDGYERSSKFEDMMWEVCSNFPQLCQNSLKGFCANVKATDLAYIPNAQKWCGCFLPEQEYKKYDNLNIPRECTPLCSGDGNIPLTDESYVPKICTNNICMIDDLAIEIISSQYGNFNFNQVCRSCGSTNISESMNDILYDSKNNINVSSTNDNPLAISTPSTFIQGNIFIPYVDSSSGKNVYPQDPTKLIEFKINGYNLFSSANANKFNTNSNLYVSDNFNLIPSSDSTGVITYASVTFNIQKSIYVDNKGTNINAWGIVSFNPNLDKPGVGYVAKETVAPVISNKINGDITTTFDVVCESVSYQSSQRTTTRANIDNVIISSNSCSCIIEDSTLTAVGAKIRGLNLTQNCGSANCTDDKGKTVACTSVSGGFNNISSVKDVLSSFQSDQASYKFSTLIISVFLIFLIFLIVFYAVFN